MRAKLYEVTQGKFQELVIGLSKQDAMVSVATSAMGLRKATLLGTVEIEATQREGSFLQAASR